jgi:signal transduction histidine kinase
MRIGIFLKILIPFLVAIGLSSYFYLRVATENIEDSFDDLLAERLEGIREGVGSEVNDLITRGEAQLQSLAKVGKFKLGLKLLKQGTTAYHRDLVNEAVYAKEVGGFDVLVFFDYSGWIAANGADETEYNQPPDTYGEGTKDLMMKALLGESVRSLRYIDLRGEQFILGENFVPVMYQDEIVGAIWMGWKLGQPFVEKLSLISSSPIEILTPTGEVVLSSFGDEGIHSGADYAQGELDLSEVVEGANLKLRLYVPRAVFRDAGSRLKKNIYQYGLITVVALVFMAALIARSITIPIRRLTKAVDDLSQGKLKGEIRVRTGDEIERLVEGFNTMARDLDDNTRKLLHAEKVAAWREVARRLAHEIKNPLSPIQLSVQSLVRNYGRGGDDFGRRLQQDGKTILDEVDRLRRLADGFSAFAKMPKPLIEESDLNALAADVARMHGDESGSIKIITDLDRHLPKLKFDREQMKQVLINLVKNAIEALDGSGKVKISTKFFQRRARVEITVEDDGAGMTEEEMRQVFNPYFTTKRGGTGLGLAIALSIVNDHGGRIWVESRKGVGTNFHVELRADGV